MDLPGPRLGPSHPFGCQPDDAGLAQSISGGWAGHTVQVCSSHGCDPGRCVARCNPPCAGMTSGRVEHVDLPNRRLAFLPAMAGGVDGEAGKGTEADRPTSSPGARRRAPSSRRRWPVVSERSLRLVVGTRLDGTLASHAPGGEVVHPTLAPSCSLLSSRWRGDRDRCEPSFQGSGGHLLFVQQALDVACGARSSEPRHPPDEGEEVEERLAVRRGHGEPPWSVRCDVRRRRPPRRSRGEGDGSHGRAEASGVRASIVDPARVRAAMWSRHGSAGAGAAARPIPCSA